MSAQTGYGSKVTPARRAAPQRSVGVPDDLWAEAARIAEAKNEGDLIGKGVSVVIRRALRQYVKRYGDAYPPRG